LTVTEHNTLWHQLHNERGGRRAGHELPNFYRWLGTGMVGTMSRRTANKKLTKLY